MEEENKNKNSKETVEKTDCIIDPKQQEIDDLNDRYKRVLAEFENFKKRSGKERETLYNSILSDIVEVFLPIVDNLENALKVETKDTEYKKGVELVLKQFKDILKSKGVEEIPALGETFDPSLHEAVSSIQDSEKNAQEIVQEYRKGYKIGNRVIRHSMVIVAN
jgi:molecular chaperone GrpE